MSIAAMKQVIELYDKHCYNNDYGGIEFNKKHGYKFIEAIEALRTAIQQAESEPVGEPRARVELIKTGGNAGLSTRIIELDIATRERLRPGDLLYTHPERGVTDDVVRDAERYRWLRDRDHWPAPFASSQDPEPVRGTDLDAAIDAAMTAAQAQKGQP